MAMEDEETHKLIMVVGVLMTLGIGNKVFTNVIWNVPASVLVLPPLWLFLSTIYSLSVFILFLSSRILYDVWKHNRGGQWISNLIPVSCIDIDAGRPGEYVSVNICRAKSPPTRQVDMLDNRHSFLTKPVSVTIVF